MPAPKPSLLGPLLPNRFRPPRGRKQVFLPNFTITLLRTPFAAPNCATFLTPLSMNKLDLKDYLYNLYGIEVLSVRSYVQQARVRQDKPGARVPKPRRWYRPRSTKKMTIEMPPTTPFIYPPAPTDFKPWDKQMRLKAQEMREREQDSMGPYGKRVAPRDGKSLREQAEELVRGKRVWRPGWMMDWGGSGEGRGKGVGGEVGV
ncbi:MAG: hypothetical protein Q9186_001699 [Xanthomendoza sp. 1 TL-2023]